MLVANTVAAQTPISGAIAADTHWTAANAPYVVNGDVVVQNGAVLTIDPGVAVFMAASSGITVQAGSIKALGTAAQPIQVLSDKTRLAQTAAPGDWKQWTFNPGTVNTRLDYVTFEHGNGLAVYGSAPIFNFLKLRNHQGAAITVDLAASPSGVGNQASGNTLNGVAVPPGDITGSVKWAVRGIPYVVASGVVSVGATPAVTSVTPNVIQQGQTLTVNLAGSRLGGLAQARFDIPGLTAQILPGGTATQASLSITADSAAVVGPAAMRLLTDAGELRINNAITLAQVQPTLTSVTPSSIFAGQGAVELTLNGRDFVNQTTVMVNSVAVSTQFVSATQLRASVSAPGAAGNVLVRLRTPDTLNAGQFLTSNKLSLPAIVAQLALTPSAASIVKGAVRTFTLAMPYPAPAGGATLNLVSSVPNIATVPANVLVPEGQSSVSFQLTAADLGNTVVTASRLGFASAQVQVTVVPPPVLTLSPSSLTLGVGRSSELTVQSSAPAGAAGLTVTLANSAPGIATVPASVTIPGGASSAAIPVSTVALGSATISAQAPEFISGSAAVNVRPVSLNLPTGTLVAPGLTRSIPLTLSDPAPAGGLLVSLVSSNPAAATVPSSITVPAGQSNVNFNLTGVAVGVASVSATADNFQAAALPVTVEAVNIIFGSPAISSVSVAEEQSLTVSVNLSRPAPAGGVLVNLAMGDPSKATVAPASIQIAQGETSGGVVQLSVSGVLKGSTTLSGSAAGLSTANIPVTVTAKPQIAFNSSSVFVGKGLNTYQSEVYVNRLTGTGSYAPNEAVTINLSSANPAKASVPASVTIPANQSSATFYVTGVDLTSGTPVTIDATATGYNKPAVKLAVNVVAPVISFISLDTTRSPASSRDDFYINFTTPGSPYSGNQTAAANMPIDLSIMEANPSGIIDGFYSAMTGGTAVTQVVLRQGTSYTYTGNGYTHVATPTAAGSYKVNASAAGVASATSALVTVTAPELKFSRTGVTVAKGFNTYYDEVYVQRALNGTAFNGAEALTVTLTSSNPARAGVPVTVTIPANQASATLYVTGVDFTSGTPATIDAAATGYTSPAVKLAVNVVAPVFSFISFDTTRSPASSRDDFYINVTTPGSPYSGNQTAAANMPIDLSIVEANPAGIIDGFYSALTGGTAVTQVVLRQGASYTYTGNGYSYVGTPTAAGSYKVNASVAGVVSANSALVTVTAPELKFSRTGVTVAKGFNTYYDEVYVQRALNGSAFNGAEALTVTLTSSNPAKAGVPATVTIPANQASATLYVTGVDFTSGTAATIDAAATGYTSPAVKLAVNVVAPVFSFISLDTTRSPASTRDDFYINVTTPGSPYSGNQTAAANMPIDLSIIEASPAGIIDGFYSALTGGTAVTQVVLRQGASYTYTGNGYSYVAAPIAAGSYKVNASAPGVASASSALVTVTPPELKFSRIGVTVGKGFKTYYDEIYVQRAVNGAVFNGAEPLTVNLACSSTAICTVPASVVIPAGQSQVYFQVSGVDLGSTTITASAVGYIATRELPVKTIAPQIVMSGPGNTTVGGLSSVSVYLNVPGAAYSSNQLALSAINVNLTSSAPGVATVPATLTIPIGSSSSNSGNLKGVAAGTTTVTASGTGLLSTTSGPITISP
jgi:hypothetical protein